MSAPHLAVDIAGETLWLLADKALYWPARQALLIADAHFGKAATYRVLGQPVPQGTTARNLQRLDQLLHDYPTCLLYTSPSPRDVEESRMPSSA